MNSVASQDAGKGRRCRHQELVWGLWAKSQGPPPPPSPSSAKNAGNEPGAKLLLLPRPTRQDFKIAPCPARLRPEPRVPAGTTHAGWAGKGQKGTEKGQKRDSQHCSSSRRKGQPHPDPTGRAGHGPKHGGGCVAPAALARKGQAPMSPCVPSCRPQGEFPCQGLLPWSFPR